jgi:hypothetical protein
VCLHSEFAIKSFVNKGNMDLKKNKTGLRLLEDVLVDSAKGS